MPTPDSKVQLLICIRTTAFSHLLQIGDHRLPVKLPNRRISEMIKALIEYCVKINLGFLTNVFDLLHQGPDSALIFQVIDGASFQLLPQIQILLQSLVNALLTFNRVAAEVFGIDPLEPIIHQSCQQIFPMSLCIQTKPI